MAKNYRMMTTAALRKEADRLVMAAHQATLRGDKTKSREYLRNGQLIVAEMRRRSGVRVDLVHAVEASVSTLKKEVLAVGSMAGSLGFGVFGVLVIAAGAILIVKR